MSRSLSLRSPEVQSNVDVSLLYRARDASHYQVTTALLLRSSPRSCPNDSKRRPGCGGPAKRSVLPEAWNEPATISIVQSMFSDVKGTYHSSKKSQCVQIQRIVHRDAVSSSSDFAERDFWVVVRLTTSPLPERGYYEDIPSQLYTEG